MSAAFETIADIPVLAVSELPSADLCRRDPLGVQSLIREVLSDRSHPLLPVATRFLDWLSLSWLVRQADPYLEEIRDVAAVIGRPGAYFLNTVYEWACSTSVAPDPTKDGARMIRVLDWGLSGMGRHVVIARHQTDHGDFYNVTWAGYAGVTTAMAPGRFSAAINQAPRVPVLGIGRLDEMITRLKVMCMSDAVLASHLLRRVFEQAKNFAAAVAMLMDESVSLAMPALFTLAGTEPNEGCVIEALGRHRRRHPIDAHARQAVGVANQWLSPDLKGKARSEAAPTYPAMSAEANNAARRSIICQLQKGDFRGTGDLAEPVLNSHTVMVMVANARRGEMMVEALDRPSGSITPSVVARRSLQHHRH